MIQSLLSKWKNTTILPLFLSQLIVLIFVILPFSYNSDFLQLLFTYVLAFNVLLGVYATKTSNRIKYFAIFLSIIVLSLNFFDGSNFDNHFIKYVALTCWISLIGLLLLVFILKTFSSSDNSFHKIQGGIACYLIIGLLFTYIHLLILFVQPNSYMFNNNLDSHNHITFQINYFSFTTLTTTGYGDITPIKPVAQTVTLLEEVIGVLFPAVFIGYLVSIATNKTT